VTQGRNSGSICRHWATMWHVGDVGMWSVGSWRCHGAGHSRCMWWALAFMGVGKCRCHTVNVDPPTVEAAPRPPKERIRSIGGRGAVAVGRSGGGEREVSRGVVEGRDGGCDVALLRFVQLKPKTQTK